MAPNAAVVTRSQASTRWTRWATPAALFLLAFAVRASPWRDVFAAGIVIPPGNDAFYHLRRIVYTVLRGGSLEFDRYLNFPVGGRPIWTPYFDLLCAAVLAPFVPGEGDAAQARLEALAMWIPPVLGAIAVVVAFALVRRHWGATAGLAAGVALSLLSGHFWYSQLGFVDHHVAVALAAAVLLAAALDLIAAHQAERAPRLWASAGWVGAWSALCLLLWPGSLLHVGLVHLGLLGTLLTCRRGESARRLARALAGSHALALLMVAPAGLAADWPQWGPFSPVVLSRFQPLLFGSAAVLLGTCAAVWTSTRAGGDARRRALAFAGLAIALAAVLLVGLPGLRDGAGDAWRWLAKRESFQSRVSESLPLLVDGGVFTLDIALVRLSALGLLWPVAVPWLLWRHRHRPVFARTAVVALFALGLLVVTLFQKRFFNSASVGLAVTSGLAFAELWALAGARRHARRWRVGLALAYAACLAPTLEPYRRPLVNELRAWRGENHAVTGGFVSQAIAIETARWLRDHTPPTRGWLDPEQVPEYGVLAPWPLGHLIEYMGRRPTLVDNFGDDLGEASFAFVDHYFLASDEAPQVDAARARGVRYVVVQGGSSFLSRRPTRGSLAHASFVLDGAGGRGVPALERHRLVHESRGLRGTPDAPRPLFKVYELVEGARIEGRAAPGAVVALRTAVTTNQGRRFAYEATARADAQGRYRFRVPYPSDAAGTGDAGVRAAPLFRLRCGEEVRGVAVPERAVLEGGLVAGPALCADGTPDAIPGASDADG